MRLEKRLIPIALVVGLHMLAALGLALRPWNTAFLFCGLVMLVQVAAVVWPGRAARPPAWDLACTQLGAGPGGCGAVRDWRRRGA